MSGDIFSYIVELIDMVSGPAKAAKGATGDLAGSLKDMSKKTFDAANAMQVGKETIIGAVDSIGASFKSLAAGDVKGAVEGVTAAVADMSKLLDLVVPGLGQAVSAVVKIAGGLVGITAGLIQAGAEFALEATAAKSAMLNMFDAMGAGVVTGEETEAMIDNLKAKTGVLKDELVDYTKAMMAMGETDLGKLETSITAIASANAIMGAGGVKAFEGLKAKINEAAASTGKFKLGEKQLAKLYQTGVNVDDIAKKMGVSSGDLRKQLAAGSADAAKFGEALESALIEKGKGPLDAMTSQLPYLKKMFMESIGDMFEDIDVKPFLATVKDLFKVFSQASPAGQAMKAGIGGFFNQVFATATKVVPVVKSFFLDIVILALKAYIAAKPVVKTIKEFAESAQGAQIITTVLDSLWSVLKVIGIAVIVVVAAFAALWAAMIAVSVTVWTVVGALIEVGTEINNTIAGWVMGAASAASDFVAGLVQGITNGASQVVGAVQGLASGATGAFKSALGISSPSKVMAELGGYTTEGFAMGVEDGTADTQGALTAAVQPPAVQGGGASGGGGGGGIVFAEGSIVIHAGGADAATLAELLPARLAEALEELMIQMGGAPA